MSSKPASERASERLRGALSKCPLIAILRGLTPETAIDVGTVLVDAGFAVLEVPMNSPRPLESIRRLATRFPTCVVGAGTVLTIEDVDAIAEAGGGLIVTPHADLEIVRHAKARGLACVPGVATPTEAFGCLRAGADALKLFPGEMLGPPVVKSIRAVLPKESMLVPVGGVSEENMAAFWAAGASAFGIGSSLYQPGRSAEDVGLRAQRLVARIKQLSAGTARHKST